MNILNLTTGETVFLGVIIAIVIVLINFFYTKVTDKDLNDRWW